MKDKCSKKCNSCSCEKTPKKLGLIEVLDVKELEDGSCSIDFEVDEAFLKTYKKETGCKRVTKAGLSKYVLSLIESSLDKTSPKK